MVLALRASQHAKHASVVLRRPLFNATERETGGTDSSLLKRSLAGQQSSASMSLVRQKSLIFPRETRFAPTFYNLTTFAWHEAREFVIISRVDESPSLRDCIASSTTTRH